MIAAEPSSPVVDAGAWADSWALTWGGVSDLLAAFALVVGIFFLFVGAFGVLRMPDAYHRLHAASKCTTLGLTGILLAACLHVESSGVISKALITIAFTFIATPIGSHLVAKASHRAGLESWKETLSDELLEDQQRGRQDGQSEG